MLCLFNTGNIVKILVSTPAILDDLKSHIFYMKKRKVLEFR